MSARRLGGLGMGTVIVCMALFVTTLTGCVGYVAPGPPAVWGGTGVVVAQPAPSMVVWGGAFQPAPVVRAYSHRGFQSRSTVRGGGFHGGRAGPPRGGGGSRSGGSSRGGWH